MSDNRNNVIQYLRALHLSTDEAALYLELLKGPSNHLELSRNTGINRTKVYRLADQLEKRSLIATRTDDRGAFLVAADPATLEVELVTQEERLKSQRAIFNQLLPSLQKVKESQDAPLNFTTYTYDGAEGFKQMLWHELKTEGEALIFGSGEIEKLVESTRWSEKHRANTVAAGYKIREITNPGGKKDVFTKNSDFMHTFSKRLIDAAILSLESQIAIYNDTVAVYHWRNDQKVGFEVINENYAAMMRQMFEHYWSLASEPR